MTEGNKSADIFNDREFKVEKVDFSDPAVKSRIEDCLRRQQECLDRKTIDWSRLNRTYTTI